MKIAPIKKELLRMGCTETDCTLIINVLNSGSMEFYNIETGKIIAMDKAFNALGIEKFSSGIARATFHGNCSRGHIRFLFRFWNL